MKKGFTLIELLVAFGIIVIIGIAVVLVLNPPELFRQGRDASRVSDIGTINKAVSVYYSDALSNPNTLFMGTSTVVYISIPDPLATSTAGDQCQGLNLPPMPRKWTYHCAASSTYMMANGTGWIPINFNAHSAGTILSKLPVDPENTTSSSLYYAYTANTTGYEITGILEAQKNMTVMASDGGYYDCLYQKGTKLNLTPPFRSCGLVAYWTFDEGSGTTVYDYSGANATGSLMGGATWIASGPLGNAISFDGSTAGIVFNEGLNSLLSTGDLSICAWVNPVNPEASGVPYTLLASNHDEAYIVSSWDPPWNMFLVFTDDGYDTAAESGIEEAPFINFDSWNQVCITRSSGNLVNFYINGVLSGDPNQSIGAPAPDPESYSAIGVTLGMPNEYFFNGAVDDYRIYNRVLSANEIQELYDAEN